MIVDPNSAESVARAIESLVNNMEQRTKLAAGGLQRFQNTFAAPVVAAQYRALFSEAVELHKRENHWRSDVELQKSR